LGRFWEVFGSIFGNCSGFVWACMGSFGLCLTFCCVFGNR
jgi:hypothetical protein